jgi:hypothetical protein
LESFNACGVEAEDVKFANGITGANVEAGREVDAHGDVQSSGSGLAHGKKRNALRVSGF